MGEGMGGDKRRNNCQTFHQAWVMQLNGHLQAEFLPPPAPSNGNFLTSQDGLPPPPVPISVSVSSKVHKPCPSASASSSSASASSSSLPTAIGPALFESFRWTFAALVWHHLEEAEGCTVEQLMEAEEWLDNPRGQHRAGGTASSPLRAAMKSWTEMSEALWRKLRKKGKKGEDEADDERKGEEPEQRVGPSADVIPCELCPAGCRFGHPIGVHMRQTHPGCGGPSGSCGYNSAGQWTTGWNGQCGEGGEGTAVSEAEGKEAGQKTDPFGQHRCGICCVANVEKGT